MGDSNIDGDGGEVDGDGGGGDGVDGNGSGGNSLSRQGAGTENSVPQNWSSMAAALQNFCLAFVSSNSENISCVTFLKHKNSRK
jgi:hypothetical protein